jgi:hypothetical protein
VAVAARQRQFIFHYRRGAAAAASRKRKLKKTREFIQNFYFKERYTVKLDEFHRLEAIALV